MGVIQNSLNQALGTVAAAGIGIKHVKEQEAANVITATREADVASEQATSAAQKFSSELEKYQEMGGDKALDAETNKMQRLAQMNTEIEATGKSRDFNGRFIGKKDQERLMHDIDVANETQARLLRQQFAVKRLEEQVGKRFKMAETLGQIASERADKYSRKWGGNL